MYFSPGMLTGRSALVTGGGTGICRGIALALADVGCDVAIASRKAEHLEPTAAEIRQRRVRSIAAAGDVRVPADVDRMIARTVDAFGRLDILVNGAAGNFICLAENPPEDFAQMRDVMARYIGPHQLTDCKIAVQDEIVEAGNWKLVMENNRECYHCVANHPELTISLYEFGFGYQPSPSNVEQVQAFRDLIETEHARWEAAGLKSAEIEELDSRVTGFRTQRLPLDKAGESLKGRKLTDEAIAEAASLVASRAKPMDNTDLDLYWRKDVVGSFVGHALREIRGDDMRAARLRIEGESADRELGEGDWIMLPAHCRHRVTWTRAEPPTVWLAIHFC